MSSAASQVFSSNRSRWNLAVATACLALGACTAPGFDPERGRQGPLPGEDEALLGVSAAYTNRESEAVDREGADFAVEATAHVASEHEVGLWALGRYSNLESDPGPRREAWAGVLYRYHWHFGDHTSVFVGPALGWSLSNNGDGAEDGFVYGAQVGLRQWLSSTVAFTVTPTYLHSDDADGDATEDLLVRFGLVFRL